MRLFQFQPNDVAILVLALLVQFWQLLGHALSPRILATSSSSIAPEMFAYDQQQQQQQQHYSYPFTFAACLIVKDDGLRLPEWLAYHYTVMPLRHLIIAADPLSITSPASLLQDYRTYTNLTIDFWTGNGYFKDGRWAAEKFDEFDPYNHTQDHQYKMHLRRQTLFYTACIRKLKARTNATWTLMIDSDEFVTYHTPLPNQERQLSTA